MRTILVEGDKTFKIKVPDGARVTFGPWSPPKKAGDRYTERSDSDKRGTLRVYANSTNDSIIAVFAGVTGFRDLTLEYSEKVAVEEVSEVWKSDEKGYEREVKGKRSSKWIEPDAPLALPAAKRSRKR